MNVHNSRERGAILAMGAVAMFAILVVAALVVDLGSTRSQRATSQVITDAAAAAGAVGLVEGGGEEACLSAVGYLDANLGVASGIDCSSFPVKCVDATFSVKATTTVDDVTVTITHPVADSDPTMIPSGVGAAAQPSVADDGNRCDRIAVSVSRPTASFFRGITGVADGATTIHSVARAAESDALDRIVNLLLLDPYGCGVLSANGNGGITVEPIIDPLTLDIYPGRIALDSDGSDCKSNDGTIDTSGGNATIRADGAPGCAAETEPGTGKGCGEIETYAAGGSGCTPPACSGVGVSPTPGKSSQRYTRAPFDWQFNCKSGYPLSYGIEDCPDSDTRGSVIDALKSAADPYNTGTFRIYPDDDLEKFDCKVNEKDIEVPVGNWIVECDLEVHSAYSLTFLGGNVVFRGDISISGSGYLGINIDNPNTDTPTSTSNYLQHSEQAAWAYMEGTLKRTGGTLELHNTMMYMSENSDMTATGNSSGSIDWTAPEQGPFANLAMWSDSTEYDFAGSADLILEGIFFAPEAIVDFSGGSGAQSIGAQFVAKAVIAGGGGTLNLAPKFETAITHPPERTTGLIR